MNKLLKNDGYALVTVLLIITVFMVLFLSFTGQYSTRAKQNKVIEKDYQSVALSEMGITYFDQAIQNIFLANKDSIQQTVKNLRQSDQLAGRLQSNDYYIEKAIELMEAKLNALSPITIPIKDKPTATFTISPIEGQTKIVRTNDDSILIDYISTGMEDGKQTKINATMTMDFSSILTADGNSGGSGVTGGSGGSSTVLTGNTITEPGNMNACNNTQKKKDFSNTNCQVTGSYSYDNNDNLTFNKSTFKITGSLTMAQMNSDIIDTKMFIKGSLFSGNMNSLNNVKMHVNGSATIGHFNGNGLTDSVIEIGGNANMDNIKLTRSTMYIGGSAAIGQINGIADSVIYINSGATIKGIDLGQNATICVNGALTVQNNFNNNSNGTSNVYALSSNNSNVITNSTDYQNACGGRNTNNNSVVTWGLPTMSAQYNYQY